MYVFKLFNYKRKYIIIASGLYNYNMSTHSAQHDPYVIRNSSYVTYPP